MNSAAVPDHGSGGNAASAAALVSQSSQDDGFHFGVSTHAPDDYNRTAATQIAPPQASATKTSTDTTTTVDGQGMWRSWTRVFLRPESACLDLLDNCFDAALHPQATSTFHGKVVMECVGETAITIINNSCKPVKKLVDAMTVYKSSKNAHLNHPTSTDRDDTNHQDPDDHDKEAIGENGVGLKQGCATLSDCSVVVTKNHGSVLEIGVIAKSLQTHQGVYLPSFTFDKVQLAPSPSLSGESEYDDDDAVMTELRKRIDRSLSKHPPVAGVLQQALGPDVSVTKELTRFARKLWLGPWQDEEHVFSLVLCNLRNSSKAPHDLIDSVKPAKTFLTKMKAMLPEYYINLPSDGRFDFMIDHEEIEFSYWQRRLVELTKFEVVVPTHEPFENLPEDSWDQPAEHGKYKLSIYCGFDAKRVDSDLRLRKGTSTCYLYIYSTAAGRLIQKEVDARHMLGLGASGVDFTQGLTVIVNDSAGRLPLTPTKDGLAWSERKNGEEHQKNLIAWTGAVAHFFWNYHKSRLGGVGGKKVKEVLKKTIQSFAEDQAEYLPVTENMDEAQFSHFQGIRWKRVEPSYDNRWKIRKSNQLNKAMLNNMTRGSDTLYAIDLARAKRIAQGKSSKPSPAEMSANEERPAKRRKENVAITVSHDWLASCPWEEIAQRDIPRVAKGILSYLRLKDKDDVFEEPILETHPTIEEDYFKVVSQPMDFRTIENDRLPSYKSIKQLWTDLVLTFQNCIKFNGAASAYGNFAAQMIDALDDAYDTTDIRQVTMRVLAYFRDVDERELFEVPVVQQIPHLKEAYLASVANPMDFRTIEAERMHKYDALEDLRADLELIFHNCIKFNGDESVYGQIAQNMLDTLDETLESIVMGKRISKKIHRYEEAFEDHEEGETEKTRQQTSNVKGKVPYKTLQKQLRETTSKLYAEQAKVAVLRKELAARDRHIEELEGRASPPVARRETSDRVSPVQTKSESYEIEGCYICKTDDDYDSMLLCEDCDGEYHYYCVNLPSVPRGDWYCAPCASLRRRREKEERKKKDDHRRSDFDSQMPDAVTSFTL